MTYVVAKLCVGLLQTWMILEIALQLRQSIPRKEFRVNCGNFQSWVQYGQYSIVSLTTIAFVLFVIIELISARAEGNDFAFEPNIDETYAVVGYIFLVQFIMMASVNVVLFF